MLFCFVLSCVCVSCCSCFLVRVCIGASEGEVSWHRGPFSLSSELSTLRPPGQRGLKSSLFPSDRELTHPHTHTLLTPLIRRWMCAAPPCDVEWHCRHRQKGDCSLALSVALSSWAERLRLSTDSFQPPSGHRWEIPRCISNADTLSRPRFCFGHWEAPPLVSDPSKWEVSALWRIIN